MNTKVNLSSAHLGDLFMSERGVLVSIVSTNSAIGLFRGRCADFPADDDCIEYDCGGEVVGAPCDKCKDMRLAYALTPREAPKPILSQEEFEKLSAQDKMREIMRLKSVRGAREFSVDYYYNDLSKDVPYCAILTNHIMYPDFDGTYPPASKYKFRSATFDGLLNEIYRGFNLPVSVESVDFWRDRKETNLW